jgi:hypothetical protein
MKRSIFILTFMLLAEFTLAAKLRPVGWVHNCQSKIPWFLNFDQKGSINADNSEAKVSLAFRLTFSRKTIPTEFELASKLAIAENGLFSLCRSLLNANEIVYVE